MFAVTIISPIRLHYTGNYDQGEDNEALMMLTQNALRLLTRQIPEGLKRTVTMTDLMMDTNCIFGCMLFSRIFYIFDGIFYDATDNQGFACTTKVSGPAKFNN